MSDRAAPQPASIDLPPGWAWARVGDIADVAMGQSPPSHTYNEEQHGLPFFQGKTEFGETYPAARKWCTDPARTADEGSILMSVRAPVGPTNIAPSYCCIGRGLSAISPHNGVEAKYLLYAFRHFEEDLAAKGTGSTFTAINRSVIENTCVPIPSINEQRRIVEKIETLLSEIANGLDSLNAVDQKLATYRQSVLKAAVTGKLTRDLREAHAPETDGNRLATELANQTFSGPSKRLDPAQERPDWLPSSWGWAGVGQLCEPARKLAYGVLQPGRGHSEGVPFVRVGDMDSGRVRWDSLKRIDPYIASKYPRTKLNGDEVLISLVGTIGRTAVADASLKGGNTARAVGVIPVSPKVNPYWLEMWLRASINRSFLEQQAHEVARKTLNLEDVRRFGVAIPPREEQDVIVERAAVDLDVANNLVEEQKWTYGRAATLRRSILNSAFTGRLAPTDPNDEPASDLLARIHAERANVPKTSGRRGRPRKTSRTSEGATR